MLNIKETIINKHFEEREVLKSKKNEIDKKIEELEKEKNLLEEQEKCWIDAMVIPLAQLLSKHLNKTYEIYGPFGINCQTSIYLSSKNEEDLMLVLRPTSLEKGGILYETGELINKNIPIGMNHGNAKVKALPETLEEIMKILR